MIPSLRMRLKRLERERVSKRRGRSDTMGSGAGVCLNCVTGCLSDSELRELSDDEGRASSPILELAYSRCAELNYICASCCGRCRYGAEHARGWRPVLLEAGINPGGYPFRNLSLEEGLEQARFDLSIEPSPCGPERR